jgi:hypothetical protein
LPDLNDRGDIVFAASLSDPEDVKIGFGAGLFVAQPAWEVKSQKSRVKNVKNLFDF